MHDIYLLRHAHVEYAGVASTGALPLSPLGHCMAERLAARCVGWDVQRLYVSTMRRAQETADHISARRPGLPRLDLDALAETNIEDLRGYPGSHPPEDLLCWTDDHFCHANERMWARAVGALADVRADMDRFGLERVAIVSHGGPINALIRYALGQEVVRLRTCWLELDWSATSCLRFNPKEHGIQGWVRWVNDARHIDDLRDRLP